MEFIEGYALATGLLIVVLMLWYSKRTDPLVGCVKHREGECANPYRGKCPFPDCNISKQHKPKSWWVW